MAEIKVRILSDNEIWEERKRSLEENIDHALASESADKEIYALMKEMLKNVKVKSMENYFKEHKNG